jgi:adenylate cyclase
MVTGRSLVRFADWAGWLTLADRDVIDRYLEISRQELSRHLYIKAEKQQLSVLVSRIRDFTTFSETMAPEEIAYFLSQYLDRMLQIISRRKGRLDNFTGDSVMCIWGPPIKEHALQGVLAALELIQAVDDLGGLLALPGGAKLEIFIGLNTGQMFVGKMKSGAGQSYSVMGEAVDFGSRLESVNKYYGTRIVISDTTFHDIEDVIFCRELDTIQVKGRSEAVSIYEPLGFSHAEHLKRWGPERLLVSPEQEEVASMYAHALGLYRKGDFDGAEISFDHVLTLKPNDGPSKLMKGRIAKYRIEQPTTESAGSTPFDPVHKFEKK